MQGRVMKDRSFYITVREEAPDRPLLSLWLGAVKVSAPVTVEDARELCDVLSEFLEGIEKKP